MGTIASSGVGSGLDVAGLVQKLVSAEGAPTSARLDQSEAKVQGKISALGTLRAALAKLQDTVSALKSVDKFQGRQVALSSQDFLSATSDSTSVPGSYQIEVQQLASAQKLQSVGLYAASTTVVGTGTLQIVIGGQTYQIAIDSSNNTLAGIAKAINASAAGSKVMATVISGATEARLTITARNTGLANAMTITQSGGDGGLAALTYPVGGGMTQLSGALNADVLVDGVPVTSATNSISGAIAGVTLAVEQKNDAGKTTTVTVDYDRAATRKTVSDFVTSYNAVVDAIKSVASYNASTKQGAPLFGDTGVLNIADQLRRVLTSVVPGVNQSADMLADIGISSGLDGKFTVDSNKLDAAFNANFDAVGQLFTADKAGVAVKLNDLLNQYLGTSGVFDKRTETLNSMVEDISNQRTALNGRLTALQDRLTKQFNALDSLLAKLQSTSSYLTQQLGNLPGFK